MMLLSLSGDNAMISLAAATTIQKIADSKIAMIIYGVFVTLILTTTETCFCIHQTFSVLYL